MFTLISWNCAIRFFTIFFSRAFWVFHRAASSERRAHWRQIRRCASPYVRSWSLWIRKRCLLKNKLNCPRIFIIKKNSFEVSQQFVVEWKWDDSDYEGDDVHTFQQEKIFKPIVLFKNRHIFRKVRIVWIYSGLVCYI